MTASTAIVLALWILLIGYWLLAAPGAKRNVQGRAWRREIVLRLAVIVLILIGLRFPAVRVALRNAHLYATQTDPLVGGLGVALCALGVGLAIWARATLGRNWGMPMSRKEEPELITSGPYARVRHPIYGGFMLALLGSALAESPLWLLPFVLLVAYFTYSARGEERLMTQEFPEQYPAYRKRTKMLVPFLL